MTSVARHIFLIYCFCFSVTAWSQTGGYSGDIFSEIIADFKEQGVDVAAIDGSYKNGFSLSHHYINEKIRIKFTFDYYGKLTQISNEHRKIYVHNEINKLSSRLKTIADYQQQDKSPPVETVTEVFEILTALSKRIELELINPHLERGGLIRDSPFLRVGAWVSISLIGGLGIYFSQAMTAAAINYHPTLVMVPWAAYSLSILFGGVPLLFKVSSYHTSSRRSQIRKNIIDFRKLFLKKAKSCVEGVAPKLGVLGNYL